MIESSRVPAETRSLDAEHVVTSAAEPPPALPWAMPRQRAVGRGLRLALRLGWCVAGAVAGLTIALSVAAPPIAPFLLASLGGSTVFLFALTRAPAAQPRALLGGHIGAAIIGIACYQLFGDAHWVYVLATAATLIYMVLTRTVHPPAGANPLLMISVHAQWSALWQPILPGVVSLAVTAAIWSRLYPGLQHYPVSWSEPSPPRPDWGGWDD